ncbi:sarcolemma associated protein, partial [Ascosphaera pollenicola]
MPMHGLSLHRHHSRGPTPANGPGSATVTGDTTTTTTPVSNTTTPAPAPALAPADHTQQSSSASASSSTDKEKEKHPSKPTIRFLPYHDPQNSSRPSLLFSTVTRTLPSPESTIKVGRYSERDGAPPANPPQPSAAAVGFKSK